MCGIAGLIAGDKTEYGPTLRAMLGSIAYRGPDESGFYTDGTIGLAHARLAILDPQNGRQPAVSEDGAVVVIYNGEIYNFKALRSELERKGHVIANNSDTAVLPHLYEEDGPEMFKKLNGQFAVAVWDKTKKKLMLGRDRFGEKPLYYCRRGTDFCFASEAKAIFQSGIVKPELSPDALRHVFTFWTTVGNESVFRDIYQLPPGSFLIYENGEPTVTTYWHQTFPGPAGAAGTRRDAAGYARELDTRLVASVTDRMIADVPVSFYISGGLDSALVACIAAKTTGERLNTFSVTFDDPHFDESEYQDILTRRLGTNHRSVRFSQKKLASVIGDVIYHAETPLLRSGAFPMYVLAGLVRESGMKVVLSGEGSDELFGGYDLFREVKIREFCARAPGSPERAELFRRVNNFVRGLNSQTAGSLSLFYGTDASTPFASHLGRWKLGRFSLQFFSRAYREAMAEDDGYRVLRERLNADFNDWTPVQRAQALEAATLFSGYLLSSQGDRVSMGRGVECRYPFLDYELADFAAALPDTMKIRGLNEKYIVKELARRYVPEAIAKRKKFPYRAPIDIRTLLRDDYVRHMLSPGCLSRFGIFNENAVGRFLDAAASKENPNERDCMLFMGFLTTQILYDRFVAS